MRTLTALAVVAAAVTVAAIRDAAAQDYAKMSLKDLMDVNITSVSRYPQPVRNVAAAVTILTREDIRRAGATTIPDALRLVPGVNVAQLNSGAWAVSARGFNDRTANKLLVMIDGRPIYTPFFSGVVWHRHDLPIANIKRIEVVRGPGGAVWGANAVNGVINIITRDSGDTQGTYGELTAGNVERGLGVLRHGGRLDRGTYRVTAKARRRDIGPSTDDEPVDDPWTMGMLRFRSDMPVADGNLRVTASARRTHVGQRATGLDPATFRARSVEGTDKATTGHLMGRWQRKLANGGSVQLTTFYDHTNVNNSLLGISRDRIEMRGRHRFSPSPTHDIVWGIRFRAIRESIDSTATLGVNPESRLSTRLSAFVQDRITLREDVALILGTKLSRNSYTGFEVQPNARVSWRMAQRHMLWGAVSRAVRVPSRAAVDGRLRAPGGTTPTGQPLVITLNGTEDVEAGTLRAFEVGYRGRPLSKTNVSVSAFYNEYTDLVANTSTGRQIKTGPPRVVFSNTFNNAGDASSVGIETKASVQVVPEWRLTATYAFLSVTVDEETAGTRPGSSPAHSGTVRSRWQPRQDLRIDATLRAVDELNFGVDAYADLDLRVAWDASERLNLALTGRNLIEGNRREFIAGRVPGLATAQTKRSVFATVRVRF